MKTALETLQAGTTYLEKRGVPEARLNMQLMLAHQLGCSKLDLYLQFDRPLGEEELAPLREMLRRRGTREPLQHVLGQVEFAGHAFKCDARALIPRPETEELVARLIEEPPPLRPGDRVVDVGTGSGVIGLSLASAWKERDLAFVLCDREPPALTLARENAVALDLEARVSLIPSDLLAEVPAPSGLIVANLPYIARDHLSALSPEVRADPASALDGGPTGLDLIERLIDQATRHLRPGGQLFLEIGDDQAEASLAFLASGPYRDARAESDLSGHQRFLRAALAES